MTWYCIEETDEFGESQRRLLFENHYTVDNVGNNPIQGQKVQFSNGVWSKEGVLVCTSQTMKFTPREILTELINTEQELVHFCTSYGIAIVNKNLFR